MRKYLLTASALLLVLERMGVSATVLWTAFTGFATVGAVAFFAAWSEERSVASSQQTPFPPRPSGRPLNHSENRLPTTSI